MTGPCFDVRAHGDRAPQDRLRTLRQHCGVGFNIARNRSIARRVDAFDMRMHDGRAGI